MKRLLLLLSFFAPLAAFAQITNDKLIGTWQLIEYQTPDGRTINIRDVSFKRLKIFNHKTFTVLDFNNTGNIIMTTIHGNYTLSPSKGIGTYELAADSNVIQEKIYGVSRESANMLDTEPVYGLKLDSKDLLRYNSLNKTKPLRETWMKVIDLDVLQLMKTLLAKEPKKDLPIPDPRMLIVLKEGTEKNSIFFNSIEKYPMPLSMLSYADINSIEFLGDAAAIKRFGMHGLHGVLILDLREGKLQPLTQTLKTLSVNFLVH